MKLKAADLMTGDILAAGASWPVGRLTEFLCEHQLSGAPVAADDGRFIGVVSLTDVARRASTRRHRAHEYYFYGPAFTYPRTPQGHVDIALLVRDIMTPAVFDVPLHATVKEIADVMLERHVHRIFVTESEMVIGIITVFDVLRVLT